MVTLGYLRDPSYLEFVKDQYVGSKRLEHVKSDQDLWQHRPSWSCFSGCDQSCVTEPAVFGVTLRLGKPFIMSMIGGGVGGFFSSLFQLKATGLGLTGIPGTLLYLNEQLPLYLLVNLIAFSTAFVLTWMFGFKKDDTLA